MQPNHRRILYFAIFTIGLAWTVLSSPVSGAVVIVQPSVPQVGFLAPAFTMTNLTGQEVHLSDYQDQVVLLNFWASWCPPCRAEMPAIQQVYQNYQDQGLIVMAIDAAYQDKPDNMQTFLGSFAHSFSILRDESGEVNHSYAISSLPTTFFIGRDGTIRDLVIGEPMTLTGLSKRIESLLQETP